MEQVEVKASKNYIVYIGSGILEKAADIAVKGKASSKIVVVSDDIVYRLYGEKVKESFQRLGCTALEFIFPNGEASKNMTTVTALLEFMAENKIARSDRIVALGGGVVGDLAGFAASIYLRGIPYIQVPTTFLAAIDSSVGGKTAVDLSCGKNLAGSFYQPEAVICDTDTFSTLPKEVFKDGVCEAIKYGCILDSELFNIIAEGDIHKNITQIVQRCVSLKRDVVEEDEFDTGNRQILNFGHTSGHALEALSGYSISHGRGVGIGMYLIQNAVNPECAKRIYDVLIKYGVDLSFNYSAAELAEKALSDKKVKGDKITVVLLEDIGKCYLKEISTAELSELFAKGMN